MQPAIAADGMIHVEFYQQGSRLGACHYGVNPYLRDNKSKPHCSRLWTIFETALYPYYCNESPGIKTLLRLSCPQAA